MLMQKERTADAPLYIRLREDDNVAIVANRGGLHPGAEFASGLRLVEQIPQGHKVALGILLRMA
jgi:galactarate dehydratase